MSGCLPASILLRSTACSRRAAVEATPDSPAAPASDSERLFRDHAEAIQRLQGRVVRIERTKREPMLRVVQLRSEPAAIAMTAQAG